MLKEFKEDFIIISIILDAIFFICDTFAPPNIAKNGRSGLSRALAKYVSSLFNKNPAARNSNPSPNIEECARCAVPNASLT